MEGELLSLCRFDELPVFGARGFDPLGAGQDQLFIVRQGDVLRAYRNACPHWQDAPMAWRTDGYLSGDGSHIVCHAHGARFDLESGRCFSGPCLGQTLQALPITIGADGTVVVALIKNREGTKP